MGMFQIDHRQRGPRQRAVYASYEILFTVVDFVAALTFVVGSIMFLSEAWTRTGTWFFIVGSFCFAAKPTIRLVREVHLVRMGNAADLADRFKG